MALWVVSTAYSDKEEAITPEEFGIMFGDDEEAKERVKAGMYEKQARTIKKNPMIKIMVQGAFHEMLDKGFFDKYKEEK